VWTSLILLFIKHVLRIPLRMSEEDLELGDDAAHGEAAYVFGPCEAHEEGYIQGEIAQVDSNADPELALGGLGGKKHHAELDGMKEVKNGESSAT